MIPVQASPIRSDDETTWPVELLSLLNDRLPSLRKYHDERRRIHADPRNRYRYPPPNEWEVLHDETIAVIDDLICGRHLIGWHCTRLTADEIERIRREGMRVTGRDLATERVHACVTAGEISAEFAKLLLAHSCAEHTGNLKEYGNRKGQIHFCFTSGLLRNEYGVSRLLSTWGGEMLYWHHADDPAVDGALRAIGTACIIEAAIPVTEIEACGSIGERFLRWFLHRHDVKTENDDDWAGHTKVSVPGSRILRIIPRSDADFNRLTECDRWSEPIT